MAERELQMLPLPDKDRGSACGACAHLGSVLANSFCFSLLNSSWKGMEPAKILHLQAEKIQVLPCHLWGNVVLAQGMLVKKPSML